MFTKYALLKSNLVTAVINYNHASSESLQEVLSRFNFDYYVDCSLYPEVFFYVGKEKFKDKFRDPQPFKSWTYSYEINAWESPIPYPKESNNVYKWNEETRSWDLCDCVAKKLAAKNY